MVKLKRVENALVFLTLLFLPTQLGKHFWPSFSYIYSLKIDYLSPTLYFWDILVVLLLVIWFLQKPKINRLALNLFLFFLFTQALSLIGASSVGPGLVRLEQYAVAGLFGVYLASVNSSKKIILPLAIGIAGESLLAILQFTKGSTLGLWILGERTFSVSTPGIAKFDFYGRQFLRPYATFPHPNVLAAFILVAISILNKSKAVLVFGSIAIFLTMSRTAIFAGFMLAIFYLKKKWLFLAGAVVLILSPILFIRFSSLANFDNLTILRRGELLGNAWQIFLKYPIFGVGLNNFIPAMAGNLITGPSRFLQPVHNIFLLALSETGIIGLIGLMSLIGLPILKLYPRRYTLYPWLIILFLGMFDHYFLTLPQGYRLLFLVWGLSFSMIK
ncbi:MAG: O-antigen ligase family protein [Patescibacteria group bacterium]